MTSSRSTILVAACALALLATPVLAKGNVIFSGVDLWHTPDDGTTVVQFGTNPIPAGFFCPGSAPFTGRVALKGVPLATRPAGAYGQTDTIMQRLDDAVFDEHGVARTRIQFTALSLVSMKPIKTDCGLFELYVSLAGVEQPISPDMTIIREADGGGYFVTRFDAEFKLSFTRVKPSGERGARSLDIFWSSTMEGTHPWAFERGDGLKRYQGYVVVDTDGDFSPDTYVPGPSNFAGGWRADGTKEVQQIVSTCSSATHSID